MEEDAEWKNLQTVESEQSDSDIYSEEATSSIRTYEIVRRI